MDNKFKKFEEDKENLDKISNIFKRQDRWKMITEDEKEHPFHLDPVDNPYHYTRGRVEAIDVIEDAIKEAPSSMAGFLQGQVLKYMLRLWHKIDAKEDAEKARWYLDKLINSL